ncbi:MAG: hypothetical protein ACE5H4_14915 [Candidatus Thorarchaeota archaeon]
MSGKKRKTLSLKAIKKIHDDRSIDKKKPFLIITSPLPEATVSSALICRSILKSGGLFHSTFLEPVVQVERVNALRQAHSKSTLIFVGIDVVGKKRVKKGTSYPIFIGGIHDSDQVQQLRIGDESSISEAAYVIARESMTATPRELQLAAAGALVRSFPEIELKGAAKEVVSSAQKDGLIQEQKGFRVFGANFLPLNEVLAYSTRPYLEGLTGQQEACEKICEEANIPFSKFRMPMSSLTNEEAQSLTTLLLPKLDSATIPLVLGQDFSLAQEREDSPARLVSGIKSMAEVAWSLQESGTSLAILMGDRAQMLRRFLDSHLAHSKDVIIAFEAMRRSLGEMETEITDSTAVVRTTGTKMSTLADVGRLSLETNLVSVDKVIVISKDEAMAVAWKPGKIRLQSLLSAVEKQDVSSTAASPASIMIENTTEEVQQGIQRILQSF